MSSRFGLAVRVSGALLGAVVGAVGLLGSATATAAPAIPPASEQSSQSLAGYLGTHVEFMNRTGAPIFVGEVEGGRHTGTERAPVLINNGDRGFFTGYNTGNAFDVRLRVYCAVPHGDHFVPGAMRQIVCGNNDGFWPRVTVRANPYVEKGETYNSVEGADFSEHEGKSVDVNGQRLWAKRDTDSPSHKVFKMQLFELASQATLDYKPNPARVNRCR